jgi:hypothetical protein
MITTVLVSVLGLIIFAILNTGTVLGAKNSAVNTAHQQARMAMLQMINNLHSSVSPLSFVDLDSTNNIIPAIASDGPAAGVSFQLWSIGPLKIAADALAGQNDVSVTVTGNRTPQAGQRLIISSHGIESDITAVVGTAPGNLTLTLQDPLPAGGIQGTGGATNYNISCFVTDRCAYVVNNGALEWRSQTANPGFTVLTAGITEATPFSRPPNSGAPGTPRLVAAINLSTADSQYSNRRFKSANILLNETIPIRSRLTTLP